MKFYNYNLALLKEKKVLLLAKQNLSEYEEAFIDTDIILFLKEKKKMIVDFVLHLGLYLGNSVIFNKICMHIFLLTF